MSGGRPGTGRDPYQRMLALGFAASVFLHVAAFVALAYAPESDRAQLIELRAASIQTYSVDESVLAPPAPPKKIPVPPKAAPPPAAKKIPVEKEPEPKKVEKPPEPKKPPPKPKERTAADTEDLIARIARKRAAEQEENAFLGSVSNEGTSAVPAGMCDMQMQIYVSEIQGRVRELWAYPGLDRRLETDIGIEISRSGDLLKNHVNARSGDTLFDESVKRAVSKATPFPPLPPCIKDSRFRAVLRFRSEDMG